MNLLEQLREMTTIVADTGDFNSIDQYKPQDATTNPSLLLSAIESQRYQHLVDEAINYGVRFSYDTQETVNAALRIIDLYRLAGVDPKRVLIKIASTWEGIEAARILEKEHGIHCNLTLLFSLTQAIACANAEVTLISPFVGRILDWHKKASGHDFSPSDDPGVISVKQIYQYLKSQRSRTIVMGASFRNTGEILELAGVDFLTISPKLLEELSRMSGVVERKLDPATAAGASIPPKRFGKSDFQEELAKDRAATELLQDGIKRFEEDAKKIFIMLENRMSEL